MKLSYADTAEILKMFGIDPEPYGEAGRTDFRFKPRGR